MDYIKTSRILDTYTYKYTEGEINQFPDDLISIVLDYTGNLKKGFIPIHNYKVSYTRIYLNQSKKSNHYIRFCDTCKKCMGSTKKHVNSKTHIKNLKKQKPKLTKKEFNEKFKKNLYNLKYNKYMGKRYPETFNIVINSITHHTHLKEGQYYT